MLTLDNGWLRLLLNPVRGASIERLDVRLDAARPDRLSPVFYPAQGSGVFNVACFSMLPWSNRVADGAFSWAGQTWALQRCYAPNELPIHGHGVYLPWQVTDQSACHAELVLTAAEGPWHYEARQRIVLDGQQLQISIEITNLGGAAPFGLGLHPFFPRLNDTRLVAPAEHVWLSASDWLPTQRAPAAALAAFDHERRLPPDLLINHAYLGWNGHARIVQPDFQIDLQADSPGYVLYADPAQPFFCLEPVDHPINALNLDGGPSAHGMTILGPDHVLRRRYAFTVQRR